MAYIGISLAGFATHTPCCSDFEHGLLFCLSGVEGSQIGSGMTSDWHIIASFTPECLLIAGQRRLYDCRWTVTSASGWFTHLLLTWIWNGSGDQMLRSLGQPGNESAGHFPTLLVFSGIHRQLPACVSGPDLDIAARIFMLCVTLRAS